MLVVEEAEQIARRFLESHHQATLRIELVTVSREDYGLPGWKIVFDTYTTDNELVDPPVVVHMNQLHKEARFLR